jgi:DNA-binding CsgD family transcriptional regulator
MNGEPPAGWLLERETELRVIGAALESARSGSGSALLVEGPAGIGKTSLMARACAQAAAGGITVLTARAAEFESGYAWGVVRQLFPPGMLGEVWQVAGDAAALAAPALMIETRAAGEDTFSVLHGLYWLTAGIAQRAPLLLAVDDLHWADQPSLRFVMHLARRLEGLQIALMLTVREPRSGTAQDKALISGLAAEASVTVLRPAALGAAACAEVVRSALGVEPSAAFQHACRELTGGNPLLLQALAASLAAEDVRGGDDDVAHLRRLTPESVSRGVLLQLGRMSAAALAAARAVAVLGTAATTARAGQLADLDSDACAEAMAALMAERLIQGEQTIEFVHPLVRSAVYQDLAAPVRQRWHARAARMLDAEGAAPEEVTVHLLASAGTGDGWVVDKLRTAAADARSRGAAEVAILCLRRAVAEPPPADMRTDVLFELGAAELIVGDDAMVTDLTEALETTRTWPRRGEIAQLLGWALALNGQFAPSVDVLSSAVEEATDEPSRQVLQAAMFTVARNDPRARAAIRPMIEQLQARAARGEDLDPRLHATLALELAASAEDREGAVRSARKAVATIPQLDLVAGASLEALSALLFADCTEEVKAAARTRLDLARRHGSEPAAAAAEGFVGIAAFYAGEISQAIAYGLQAIAGTPSIWIATNYLPFVIRGLIERDELNQAEAMLTERGLMEDLLPIYPHILVRHARACLHAAVGDHPAAVADLLSVGEQAESWGFVNPAVLPWRSDAALSLAALGRLQEARQSCATELDFARNWGSARALGIALRAAGLVEGGDRGLELLTEAVSVLRPSPALLELARALVDLGAAQRRAGARTEAREHLREGLDLAHRQGALRIAGRARRELVIAGGKPRRNALRGRDALTPSELGVAELAAAGQTNRQIAQALFITQRTVENHLTSAYGKLGIGSRTELAATLTGG